MTLEEWLNDWEVFVMELAHARMGCLIERLYPSGVADLAN